MFEEPRARQAADADHVLVSESVAAAYEAHRGLPPPPVQSIPAKGKPAGIPCARFDWRAAAFAPWPPPPPPSPLGEERRGRAAESWFPAAPGGPAGASGDWGSQGGTPRSGDSGGTWGGDWGDRGGVLGTSRGGEIGRASCRERVSSPV